MLQVASAAARLKDPLPLPASVPRWKRAVFALLLSGLSICLPARGHTAGLDCPETGPGAVPDLAHRRAVKTGDVREQRRSCQRDQRSHQQAADREALRLLRRANECCCRRLLSRRREPGEFVGLGEMASHAPVRYNSAAAARRQHVGTGNAHHRQRSTSPAVYRELRSQAAKVDRTPAQLIAAILSRAAGN